MQIITDKSVNAENNTETILCVHLYTMPLFNQHHLDLFIAQN